MTRRLQYCFLTSMMLFVSCSESFAQTQNFSVWKNEIQAVLDQQADAWNIGSVEGYMEGYWKSDSLLFTSGGNIRRGWKATFEKYKQSYDTQEKMGTLKFSKLEYYLLSPDVAWVLGEWELNRKSDRPHGIFTLILKKFSEGWKIVHDHTSSSK